MHFKYPSIFQNTIKANCISEHNFDPFDLNKLKSIYSNLKAPKSMLYKIARFGKQLFSVHLCLFIIPLFQTKVINVNLFVKRLDINKLFTHTISGTS